MSVGITNAVALAASIITSAMIQNSAVTTDKLASNAVTQGKIADGAVGSGQLADGAVTAGKMASGVVPVPTTITPKMDGEASQGTRTGFSRGDHVHPSDTAKANSNLSNVSNGAVKTAMLDDGVVTAAKIASGAVTAEKLAAESVGTSKLVNGSVSRDKIYANAVSEEKAVTIPSDAVWTKFSDYDTYYLDFPVSGVLSTDKGFINLRRGAGGSGFSLNKINFDADVEALNKIYNYSIQQDGYVRFIASEPITRTLYLTLLLVHK